MRKSFYIKILGMTVTVPSQAVDLNSYKKEYGEAEVRRIVKATGIESVRVAPEGTCASDLCLDAAERLFKELSFDRSKIGGLVFVSQTPDYQLPSTACILQDKLELPNRLAAFEISYGCSAYAYGIFQAALLINSGMADYVLVLTGDTLVRKINPGDRSVRMVFGDAGSATLVGKGGVPAGFRLYTDGSGSGNIIIPAGGSRIPVSPETSVIKKDDDGNTRSLNDLYMDGMEIMRFTLARIPKIVEELLRDACWKKEELDYLFLHQANKFIIEYLKKKSKLPKEKVPIHIRDYGNTGPASIPLAIIEELQNAGKLPEKCLMVGFGVGFSWAGFSTGLKDALILPVGEL